MCAKKNTRLLLNFSLNSFRSKWLLSFGLWLVMYAMNAQTSAPGGVEAGYTEGWRYDVYEGSIGGPQDKVVDSFGLGTNNRTAKVSGYTDKVRGNEHNRQSADFVGTEYIAEFLAPSTGQYGFQFEFIDDVAAIWVNNQLLGVVTRSNTTAPNFASNFFNINLPSGYHVIRIKHYEYTGGESLKINVRFPNNTVDELDGKYVRYPSSLSHWYRADAVDVVNENVLNNYVSVFRNQAPTRFENNNAFLAQGKAPIKISGQQFYINYNPAAVFDGNTSYITQLGTRDRSSHGIAIGNSSLQVFMPIAYQNFVQNRFLFNQGFGCGAQEAIGIFRNATSFVNDVLGVGGLNQAKTILSNEPMIVEMYNDFDAAGNRNIPFSGIRVNASAFTEGKFTFDLANINKIDPSGIHIGGKCANLRMATVLFPEFIYYPYKLSDTETQKVNTYLAIKYGITSQSNYMAPNGVTFWSRSSNSAYNNRIFGIGRDLAISSLNQKQSQSQFFTASDRTNNFIRIAIEGIYASNADNPGDMPEGAYLVIGDNNSALNSVSGNISSNVFGPNSCGVNRINRQWKVGAQGNVGSIYIEAGGDNNTFKFVNSFKKLSIVVDEDGDGDFLTGTQRLYPSSEIVANMAIFKAVELKHNEVFTIAWQISAPGGVSAGLAHWVTLDDFDNTYLNVSTSNRSANGSWPGLPPANSQITSNSSWSVDDNNIVGRYLQLDLGSQKRIKGFVTKGRADLDQWVTAYQISYSLDNFVYNDIPLVFDGNSDRNTLISNYLDSILVARYIRFIPLSFVVHKSMRADVIVEDEGILTTLNDRSTNKLDLIGVGGPVIKENLRNYNPGLVGSNSGFENTTNPNFNASWGAMEAFGIGRALQLDRQNAPLFDYGGQAGLGSHYTWDNGGIYERFGTTDRIGFEPLTTNVYYDFKTGITSNNFSFNPLEWSNYNTFSSAGNWGININSNPLMQTNTNSMSFDKVGGKFGINVSGTLYGNSEISEVILYNRILQASERNKINSYFALKYSLTLNNGSGNASSNYVSSDGQNIWFGNPDYKFFMFGVGRDDCGFLDQRQSQSFEFGKFSNFCIGVDTIVENGNQKHPYPFNDDKSFVVLGAKFGSDNIDFTFANSASDSIPLAYATTACNPVRWRQVWKVKNTNITQRFEVRIGASATGLRIQNNMSNPQLVVDTDGDNNLLTGSPVLYRATSLVNGVATYRNVSLTDGATVTMLWDQALPGGVRFPDSGVMISGRRHVPGVRFTLNRGFSFTYPLTLDLSTLPALPGSFISSGIVNNPHNAHNVVSNKISDFFGMRFLGKLRIPATSSTYKFQIIATNQARLLLNGSQVLNMTSQGTVTSLDVNLTQGYHDFDLSYAHSSGAENIQVLWNGGSGNLYTPIPDSFYFFAPDGPSIWLSSDDQGLSSINDSAVIPLNTIWSDLSLNSNNVTLRQGQPILYKFNLGTQNFHQRIAFNENRFSVEGGFNISNNLRGFPYGSASRTIYQAINFKSTNTQRVLFGYGQMNNGNAQIGYTPNFTLAYGGFAAEITGTTPFWNTSDFRQAILSYEYTNSNIVSGNNIAINNKGINYLQSSFNSWYTTMAPSVQFQLGNRWNSPDNQGWKGDLFEYFIYPWKLSRVEQNKINSYIATKWGMTLDQTTPTNYINSSGNIVWNATDNILFNKDITGIGRDDCAGLNQKQSTATDGNDIISIGLRAIAPNNQSNTGSFTLNNSFLYVGHNGGTYTNWVTNIPMPTSITNSSACYVMFGRMWRVDATQSFSGLEVKMGKVGQFLSNKGFYKPILIVSANRTNFSTARIYNAVRIDRGVSVFQNVVLNDGDHISMALIQASPGGVKENLEQWIQSDSAQLGMTLDKLTATNWLDQTLFLRDLKSKGTPIYQDNSLNFNASVWFNGTNAYFQNSLIDTPYTFPKDFKKSEIFSIVKSTDTTSNSAYPLYYGGKSNFRGRFTNSSGAIIDPSATTQEFGFRPMNNVVVSPKAGINFAGINFDPTRFNIYNQYSDTNNWGINIMGQRYAHTNINTPQYWLDNLGVKVGFDSLNYFKGNIAEIISFSKTLSEYERKLVNSYLAGKYGFTIPQDYIISSGDTIWNYSRFPEFNNRIFGVIRDDCGALDQKQAKSSEDGAFISISNGNRFFENNNLHNRSLTRNFSACMIGDNNRNLLWTGKDLGKIFFNVRLNRVWRVQEIGNVGSLAIKVPDNSKITPYKLPRKGLGSYFLIVTRAVNNGNFSANTNVIETPMVYIPEDSTWQVNYNFLNGDYFTFSTQLICVAPAGVSDGLTSWYQVRDEIANRTIANGDSIDDRASGSLPLIKNNTGTATINQGNLNTMNFNYHISLSGNGFLSRSNLNLDQVFLPKAGSVFAVSNSPNGLLTYTRSNGSGVWLTNQVRVQNKTLLPTGLIPNIPNLHTFRFDTATISIAYNAGAPESTPTDSALTSGSYTLGLGGSPNLTTYNNSLVGDVITYSQKLPNVETQSINSYLALRYGITLKENYYSPDWNGRNDSSELIYDVSSFSHRIIGIARDQIGCFIQSISRSTMPGSLITLSANTKDNYTSNPSNFLDFLLDRTYLIIGDNDSSLTWRTLQQDTTLEFPKIYETLGCPFYRMKRIWKVKPTNFQKAVKIFIPSHLSNLQNKLDSMPAPTRNQSFGPFVIINKSSNFAIDRSMDEVPLVYDPISRNYSFEYTFEDRFSNYFFTFTARPTSCKPVCLPINPSSTRASSVPLGQ